MKEAILGIRISVSHTRAWVYGTVGGIFGLLLASMSANYQIVFALFDTHISFISQLVLSFKTLVYWYAIMSLFQQILAVIIAILVSMSVGLTYVYMKTKGIHNLSAGFASGMFGFISATIGLHCIACGAVVLSFIFSLLGISSAFLGIGTTLSFVLGILLLLISIYITARKIASPNVCEK